MQELGHKEDYFLVFEVEGFNLLLSDMIMQSYGPLGQVELYLGGHLREYSNKSFWPSTSSEGLQLYGSDQQFASYLNHLTKVFSDSQAQFRSICSGTPTPEAIRRFFQIAKELLDVYVKMSSMFTDEAYSQSEGNKVLAHNLARVQKQKEKYRQSISKMFLDYDSDLSLLLRSIAELSALETDDLWWYTIAELAMAGQGHRVDSLLIEQRRKSFLQIGDAVSITSYFGEDARSRIGAFDMTTPTESTVSGMVASRGQAARTIGQVKVINLNYSNARLVSQKMEKMQKGEILVSQTTSPELMQACRKAGAIVTDAGGLLSHAAIVSREFGIPCIVGTGNASKRFKDGDMVEVDTDTGIVRIATQATET